MLANKLDVCKGKCLQPPGAEEGGKPWSGITLSPGASAILVALQREQAEPGQRQAGPSPHLPVAQEPRTPERVARGAWEDRRRKEGRGRWK